MIQKYVYGVPFETDAVVVNMDATQGVPAYGDICMEEGFSFTYEMDESDIVYGLGENMHGINKRGHLYKSECEDGMEHSEDRHSLYCAHNFVIVSGKENFGLFIDNPASVAFDVGFTKSAILKITSPNPNLKLYVIDGENAYDIVKQFRKIIGKSYIPPKFAFGYGQSRWGYKTDDDFRYVAKSYRDLNIPLDMIYMDIDYMDHYKDFTLNTEYFPDFEGFVKEMKEQDIRLVPIIDAGVKVEKDYNIYEEGVANEYFCKRADGTNFVANVWPGETHFPDVLNADARKWFGDHYRFLTDKGIEAFWNDMNEPSIFYSQEGMADFKKEITSFLERKPDPDEPNTIFPLMFKIHGLSNSREDFKRFYHNVNGQMVCHADVHNLFGYNMTRAAGEAFERIDENKRFLMFSRSSYIGMHRYGGIWTGDNKSWWAHLLLNLKMMPSLNMCGFLYTGADLGGFGSDTTRDLLLRWLALGAFTPLMRNHSAFRTREQECYQFENPEDFSAVIGARYRMIPYLYSEYMKAALGDDMYFKPLAFEYPNDKIAVQIEDQLMLGNEIMIAPVYTQNATGRVVYLPERMKFVKFQKDERIEEEILEKGWHFVEVALNEVPLFIREGKCIPVVKMAQSVDKLDMDTMELIGFDGASYALYEDDGMTKEYKDLKECRILTK